MDAAILLVRCSKPSPFRLRPNFSRLFDGEVVRREAAAHGVLGDAAGKQELQQVIRAAGLGADPGELETAERLAIDHRSRDWPVHIQVADAEFTAGSLDVRWASRIESAGQGVFGPIRNREGLGQVAGAQNRQDRPEDFLPGDPGGRLDVGDDEGTDVGPLVDQGANLDLGDNPPFRAGDPGVFPDSVAGAGVDHGPDGRVGVVGRADGKRMDGFGQSSDEGVVNTVKNDNARTGGTLLPRVAEGTLQDADDRLVKVGVVVHDQGVLASHLGDNTLDVVLTGLRLGGSTADFEANGARAGEGDQINPRMLDEGLADVSKAREQGQGSFGKPGLAEDFGQEPAHDRRPLARFQHNGIAGHERGDGHAAGDRQREVPRRDHHRDSARQVLGRVGLAGHIAMARLRQAEHLTGVILTEIDRLGDVGVGLAPGFGALIDLPRGQLGSSLPHDLGRSDKHGRAGLGRGRRPGGEGPSRRLDGQGRVSRIGPGEPTDDAREVARIGRVEGLGRIESRAGEVDRIRPPEPSEHEAQGVSHREANGPSTEVAERLIPKRRQWADSRRRGSGLGSEVPQPHGANLLGIAQQVVDPGVSRETRLQERLVRRVFEQPADEVGHPRQQRAIRRVDPDPVPPSGDGPLHRRAHAVKHLDLVTSERNPERLGGGHRVGKAPHVMTAECRTEPSVVHQQELGATLVARVRLPFSLIDGHRPVKLVGEQDLVVPVRSLDQSNRHPRAALLDPGVQVAEVALRGGQIRLGDDADVGPVAELGLHQDGSEDALGQVFVSGLLHIDVDVSPQRDRLSEDHAESRRDLGGGDLGVEGVEAGGEVRQLQGKVHARDRPEVVVIDDRVFRFGGERPGQPSDQVQAGLLIDFGLALADDGLAEQVGGEGEPLASQRADGRKGLGGVLSGDKPSGVVRGREPGEPGERPDPKAVAVLRREGHGRSHPPGGRASGFAEVFSQMPTDVGVGSRRGDGVNEPKKLDANRGIVQSQRRRETVPPRPFPDCRPTADRGEQGAADLLRASLQSVLCDAVSGHRRRQRRPSPVSPGELRLSTPLIMYARPSPSDRKENRVLRVRVFPLDGGRVGGIESSDNNLARILSRVAEGRARRRHSNRSTFPWMLVLTPAQRIFATVTIDGQAEFVNGTDKMVFRGRFHTDSADPSFLTPAPPFPPSFWIATRAGPALAKGPGG